MKINRKYRKRFRHQAKRTDQNVLKILAERDASVNRQTKIKTDWHPTAKCRSYELYQFMRTHGAVKHERGHQELQVLSRQELREFRRQFHLSAQDVKLSRQQIKKL